MLVRDWSKTLADPVRSIRFMWAGRNECAAGRWVADVGWMRDRGIGHMQIYQRQRIAAVWVSSDRLAASSCS